AGAAGVLPLRLGRQVAGAAGLLGQPAQKLLRVGVGDHHDRVVVGLGEAGVAPGVLAGLVLDELAVLQPGAAGGAGFRLGAVARLLHEALELADGDGVLADVEVAADRNLVGLLVVAAAGLVGG